MLFHSRPRYACCASTAYRHLVFVALAALGCAKAESSSAPKGRLAPSGVVSQQELQSASAALASAESAEASAQAQISGLAIRLGETRITSPITGYVSARRL